MPCLAIVDAGYLPRVIDSAAANRSTSISFRLKRFSYVWELLCAIKVRPGRSAPASRRFYRRPHFHNNYRDGRPTASDIDPINNADRWHYISTRSFCTVHIHPDEGGDVAVVIATNAKWRLKIYSLHELSSRFHAVTVLFEVWEYLYLP